VIAAPPVEVRTVGDESFGDIYPLLQLFGNRKMRPEDWRRMLFAYPWADGRPRGFAIYAGAAAVGFIGTIFSRRMLHGRERLLCNASCWIVRDEFRSASMLLLKPLLAMRDCTLLNLTPTARSYEIFSKLGFRPLEREQMLLAPLAHPGSLVHGTFALGGDIVAADLRPHERTLAREVTTSPDVVQLVLRRGSARCYLVLTLRHVRRVPIAELLHIGDIDFFWKNRALAHVAAWRALGVVGLALDARFAQGRAPAGSLRRPAPRLYRPAEPELPPEAIDGLFSELMVLKI
jgi:hypothetical protein